ncbi:MAG: ribosome-associated translation inhibitor RaiA [Candidatus Caldarchaeum sp.]
MKIRVSERHMAESEALNKYAVSKVEALSRYFDGIISVDIVMDVEKERQIVEIVAHLVKRKVAKASAESDDMYASIDQAVDKLKQQLRKYKDQLREKRPARQAAAEARQRALEDAQPKGEDNIIYTKVHLLKPMTLEEARLQLESYNRDFLIFVNADSRALNILHRHKDGQYELLEPVY